MGSLGAIRDWGLAHVSMGGMMDGHFRLNMANVILDKFVSSHIDYYMVEKKMAEILEDHEFVRSGNMLTDLERAYEIAVCLHRVGF